MKKINLRLNGKTAYFELFEKEAPITCAKLLEILPQKIDIHYAKFAGQEILGVIDDELMPEVRLENGKAQK